MIWNRRPRRKVPVPDVSGPKTAANPLFPKSQPWLRAYRQSILITTSGLLILIGAGLTIYGSWFQITNVTIRGNQEIDSESLRLTSEDYLNRRSFGIIPNRNLVLLSASDMSQYLRRLIEKRIAVEAVHVIKQYPNSLIIEVQERVPVFIWQSGSLQATMDRRGTVVEFIAEAPESLPSIIDENQSPIAVGQMVLSEAAVKAMLTLVDGFDSIHQPVAHYLIPMYACPTQNKPVNSNQNLNGESVDEITPLSPPLNVNASLTNTPACDLTALQHQSPEIHVQLPDNGPRLMFDRRQDLRQAILIVQRLLLNPENRSAQYIDIRFGERVFIK